MFCPECGSPNAGNARFCSNCGVPLATTDAPDDRTVLISTLPPVPPAPPAAFPSGSARHISRVPVIIASVLAVCVLALCGFLIIPALTDRKINIAGIEPEKVGHNPSVSKTVRGVYLAETGNSDIRFQSFDWLVDDYITAGQIEDLPPRKLRILRNAIFAIHGYKFRSDDLTEYFSRFDWYTPVAADVTSSFSFIEKKNIETIKKLEQ